MPQTSDAEINALRRLMESVNKATASHTASIGKLTSEQQLLRQQLCETKLIADRALQLCGQLMERVKNLEHNAGGNL